MEALLDPFRARFVPKTVVRNAALTVLVVALHAATAPAAPLVGFVENFSGVSLQSWGGGAELVNPGTGGADGLSDGFLLVSMPFPGHLGANAAGPEYAGDWIQAGINKVHVWLNDVNSPDPIEIHFAIGNGLNFWEYNSGFFPPSRAWKEFVVDLSDPMSFTRIIGQGTFQAALQRVDRILLRHDKAPFMHSPDYIQGDFGLDKVWLTNDAVPVRPLSWGRLKGLYR
jgi:hypothetical protein